jgi:CheY-like chemotaxis protein
MGDAVRTASALAGSKSAGQIHLNPEAQSLLASSPSADTYQALLKPDKRDVSDRASHPCMVWEAPSEAPQYLMDALSDMLSSCCGPEGLSSDKRAAMARVTERHAHLQRVLCEKMRNRMCNMSAAVDGVPLATATLGSGAIRRRCEVLAVDDNPINQMVLESILSDEVFELTTCMGGQVLTCPSVSRAAACFLLCSCRARD